MSLTLKQLETLIWVADLRSFKGAAERLNTTQPNISARINAVETLVGEPLLDRSGKALTVTAKGRELVESARDVLHARDAFLVKATDQARTQGRLRLGVTEMVVHTWLRDFTLALKAAYPNVAVELTVDMASELDRLLAAHQLDMAFMNGPFGFQIHGVQLGQFSMVWVAAPSLELPMDATRDDLAGHPILTHARGTWPHRTVADHFQGTAAQLVPSSNLAVCQQMARDAMGIALLPYAMVHGDVHAGTLVVLDYDPIVPAMCFEARFDPRKAPFFAPYAADLAQSVAQSHHKK